MDLESRIRNGPMTPFQVSTMVICTLAIFSDGYDILVISLSAPFVSEEWGISPASLGYIISGATAGMVIGAMLIAPLGDRFGRRRIAILGQVLVTAGMLMAWMANNYEVLLLSRIITGIGMGALTAVMAVIFAEFSTKRWLGFTLALYSAGTGLGGFIAGLTSQAVMPAMGWQALFMFGALANVLILVLVVIGVPESLQHLSSKRGNHEANLLRINRTLIRMRRKPLLALPQTTAAVGKAAKVKVRSFLNQRVLFTAGCLAISFCLMYGWFYFNLGWTPQLITSETGDAQLGTMYGTVAPLGGAVGGLLFGLISFRAPHKLLSVVSLGVTALGCGLLGYFMAQGNIPMIVPFIMAVGFGAALGGMHVLIPRAFPSQIRTSAFGFIFGLGRLAGTVGPIFVGYLVEAGWMGSVLFLGSAVLLAIATLALLPVKPAETAFPASEPEDPSSNQDSADKEAFATTNQGRNS